MNVPVRDASTLMLLRDATGSIEVLMLQRHPESVFAPGAFVFPGGAVDEADSHPSAVDACSGRTDQDASARLGIARGGLAFWVAAVRESFEEAGVLLAGQEAGPLSLTDAATARRFGEHRAGLWAGRLTLGELCELEGLTVDAASIHYFSHWITPEGPPRRFDTHFFVAEVPPDQEPSHDDDETVDSVWISPAVALDKADRGDMDVLLPTRRNLEALADFDTTGAVITEAAGLGPDSDLFAARLG